jgi:tetratricopeptide (TPR) repeat protein
MKQLSRFVLFSFVIIFFSGCGLRPPVLGIAGKYRTGRNLLILPGGRGVAESIPYLEEVAKGDPFYQDTLTLLGRALYYQGAYQDAFQLLQRALVINKEDEIAWLTLGLTRLRLGDDQAGFENIKTGVALINKVSKNGYRGYVRWDINGLVRSAIRRTLVVITRDGLTAKEALIRASEQILLRIDDEEVAQEAELRRAYYKEDFKR